MEKKIYETPELEVLDVELETALLAFSGGENPGDFEDI